MVGFSAKLGGRRIVATLSEGVTDRWPLGVNGLNRYRGSLVREVVGTLG